MKNKKSQQAVEFLVTYGWVFIIIGIAVAALIVLGVTNPGHFMQSYCEFGSSMKCRDYVLTSEGTSPEVSGVMITLQNNYGRPVQIHKIYGVDIDVHGCSVDAPELIIGIGQEEPVWCNLNTRLVRGNKQKITLTAEWSRAEEGAARHNVTGRIYSKILNASIDGITFEVRT